VGSRFIVVICIGRGGEQFVVAPVVSSLTYERRNKKSISTWLFVCSENLIVSFLYMVIQDEVDGWGATLHLIID
jgi:hypothetical protein